MSRRQRGFAWNELQRKEEVSASKRNKNKLPLVAAAMLPMLLTSRAHAQVTKVGEAYQLRVKYAAGTKLTYAMKTTVTPMGGATMSIAPGGNTLAGPIVVNVQSVKDANATLKVTLGPCNPTSKTPVAEQAETIQVDAQNKLLDTGTGTTRIDISMPVFSPDPMTVGERYTTTQKLLRGGRVLEVISTYYLRGLKTVGGQQVAELEASVTGKGDVQYTNHGTVYVTVSDGILFRSDMKQAIRIGNAQRSVYLEAETVITRK